MTAKAPLVRLFRLLLPHTEGKTAIDCLVSDGRGLAQLYHDFREVEEGPSEVFEHYRHAIEQDLPRTFPTSKFVEAHRAGLVRLLRAFVLYEYSIGYIQGHGFLAAASLYYFGGKTPYLSFWLMVALFDNLKHIFILQIDETFQRRGQIFEPSVLQVVEVFLRCYQQKHRRGGKIVSGTLLLALQNLVQWKLVGTLMLSCCGMDLCNTPQVLEHYLPVLYDRQAFRRRASATALSFLFCCFMEKELSEELVLKVQSSNLSASGLRMVLEASVDTEKLLL
tara:strand:+ start:1415 stop:2251 length:837 start_codon:yes stop_codon:yes gene_type:complete